MQELVAVVFHVATTIKPSTSHHVACVKWARMKIGRNFFVELYLQERSK